MDFLEEMKQRGYYYDEQLGELVKDDFIRDHEFATKKWQTLRKQCGCDNCDECGNNGCGSILIDGWEFEDVDEEGAGAVSRKRDEASYLECYRMADRRREQAEREEYAQMKSDIEDGTHMFKACIKAALELMPKDCTPDVYGDIVRSAAAVVCHSGKAEE